MMVSVSSPPSDGGFPHFNGHRGPTITGPVSRLYTQSVKTGGSRELIAGSGHCCHDTITSSTSGDEMSGRCYLGRWGDGRCYANTTSQCLATCELHESEGNTKHISSPMCFRTNMFHRVVNSNEFISDHLMLHFLFD